MNAFVAPDPRDDLAYWQLAAQQSRARGPERQELARDLRTRARERLDDYARHCMANLVNEPSPFDEELVWFWFNHFNVFWRKGHVGFLVPDYVETAIRAHVRGDFVRMLAATMTHPAMLLYLDNARNVAGRINENYARELLELHTLGVGGGYGQGDVQEVARVLTGLGVVPPRAAPQRVEAGQGLFAFRPALHDQGAKTVLGAVIDGRGLAEIETLARRLAVHPSTARHLARKLCTYFVADDPPAAVVDAVAGTYLHSGGNLARVTAEVARAMDPARRRPGKFKDPLRYVVSSARLLADGSALAETRPLVRWVARLDQPLFGRSTPDGYSLRGSDWTSSGQLTRRFEVAREMAVQLPRLLGRGSGPPLMTANGSLQALHDGLAEPLKAAVAQAGSPAERAALLLSSPNHMYW